MNFAAGIIENCFKSSFSDEIVINKDICYKELLFKYFDLILHLFHLSERISQNLPVMKQHFDLEIFFLAVGCRPESGHVFDPIGLDPDQPEHRKRK